MYNNENSGAEIVLNGKKEKISSNDVAVIMALRERKQDVSLNSGTLYDALRQICKRSDGMIIPSTTNPAFVEFYTMAKFYAMAREHAHDSKEKERVNLLLGFVNENIKNKMIHKHFWSRGLELEKSIRERSGVCRDKAAILQLILQEEKFQSSFMVGTVKSTTIEFHRGKPEEKFKIGDHAWLKVRIGEIEYLADPTNEKTVKTYDVASKSQMYVYKESTAAVVRGISKTIVMNPTRLEGGDLLEVFTLTYNLSGTAK